MKLTDELKEKIIEEKEVLYDPDAENTIYFAVEAKGKEFRVGHTFAPLTDERYFKFEAEGEASAKRIQRRVQKDDLGIDTEDFSPIERLWDDLCISRVGYAEKGDWKQRVKYPEKIETVRAFFFVDLPETEIEAEAGDGELLDDDDVQVSVRLDAYQNGALISTEHFLGEASRAQIDEFFAIKANRLPKGVIASAKQKKAGERYCDLYDALIDSTIGYAGRVPAWHKERVVMRYFDRVLEVGKLQSAVRI
jgi:hypothetical protein